MEDLVVFVDRAKGEGKSFFLLLLDGDGVGDGFGDGFGCGDGFGDGSGGGFGNRIPWFSLSPLYLELL